MNSQVFGFTSEKSRKVPMPILFYKGNFKLKIPSELTQSKFTGSKVLFILFLHMHYLLVTQQQVQETIDKLSP